MPDPFDAYEKWLGILPAQQPPDYYRLLGVPQFSRDHNTIAAAAEERTALLRNLKVGAHRTLAERLLNEIAAARACLLDESRRAVYDARLRASNAPLPPRPGATSAAATPQGPTRRPAPSLSTRPGAAITEKSVAVSATKPSAQNPGLNDVTDTTEPVVEQIVAATTNRPVKKNSVSPSVLVFALASAAGVMVVVLGGAWFAMRDPARAPVEPPPVVAKVGTPARTNPAIAVAPPAAKEPPAVETSPAARTDSVPMEKHVPLEDTPAVPLPATPPQPATKQPDLREPGPEVPQPVEPAPADRAAVLSAALREALASGDVPNGLSISSELAQVRGKDSLTARLEVLELFAKGTTATATFQRIVDEATALAREATTAARPEVARPSAVLALVAARRVDDPKLLRATTLLVIETQEGAPK